MSWVFTSPICWFDSVVLLVPTNRLDLERKSSTLASASETFLRRLSISPASHWLAFLALLLAHALLEHEIAVGDRIGDAGGELGIGGLEFDHDHARLVDRVGLEAFVIGVEHALFRRHRERIAGDTDERGKRLQRRDALQHRVEFGAFRELVLLDDLPREIARQHQLHLAGDGLGVERLPLLGAVAVRAQEHVLAAIDQDAGFRLVARRDEIDDSEGRNERQHRWHDDPAALARQCRSKRAQIDVAGFDLCLLRGDGRRARFNLGFDLGLDLGLDLGRRLGSGLRDCPLDHRLGLAVTPER
ncbi:hypothetical protein ACVIHB_003928 [Bradyrhizobium liaoningense]